jgi:hypothetical protein
MIRVNCRYGNGSDVFYRESNDSAVENKMRDEIARAFPDFQGIQLRWLFITTWFQVRY